MDTIRKLATELAEDTEGGGGEFELKESAIDEAAEADRKRRLEYSDDYGEPLKPGGIMSVAQERGEEAIKFPPGGLQPLGRLNLETLRVANPDVTPVFGTVPAIGVAADGPQVEAQQRAEKTFHENKNKDKNGETNAAASSTLSHATPGAAGVPPGTPVGDLSKESAKSPAVDPTKTPSLGEQRSK